MRNKKDLIIFVQARMPELSNSGKGEVCSICDISPFNANCLDEYFTVNKGGDNFNLTLCPQRYDLKKGWDPISFRLDIKYVSRVA